MPSRMRSFGFYDRMDTMLGVENATAFRSRRGVMAPFHYTLNEPRPQRQYATEDPFYRDRILALNDHISNMFDELKGRLAPYAKPSEKEELLAALEQARDWMRSPNGTNAHKDAYIARRITLQSLEKPIQFRYRERIRRPEAIADLRMTLNDYMARATSDDGRFAHIHKKDKQSIVEKAATIQKWLNDQIAQQAKRALDEDPALTAAEITERREEMVYFARPILTRPRYQPPVVNTSNVATPNGTRTARTDTPVPARAAKAESKVTRRQWMRIRWGKVKRRLLSIL